MIACTPDWQHLPCTALCDYWDAGELGECEPVEWVEGSADCDWRAAAYERAATRPCTDLPTWTLGGRRAKHCRQVWLRDGASCISVHAVARSPGACI